MTVGNGSRFEPRFTETEVENGSSADRMRRHSAPNAVKGQREGSGRSRGRGSGRAEAPEVFAGAVALDDLPRCVGDPEGASRVLARYAVARVASRAIARVVVGRALSRDLSIAREYTEVITPPDDTERRALDRILDLLVDPAHDRGTLERALVDASRESASRGAPGGALALELVGLRLKS